MTWAETKSQTLNWLSHLGTPQLFSNGARRHWKKKKPRIWGFVNSWRVTGFRMEENINIVKSKIVWCFWELLPTFVPDRDIKCLFIYLLKKNFFFQHLFIFGTKRDRAWTGEGQRERETQNRKQPPGSEPSAQSPTQGSNSRTARSWPGWSRTLNRLRHPGAPKSVYF